jgi:hypothetical protein
MFTTLKYKVIGAFVCLAFAPVILVVGFYALVLTFALLWQVVAPLLPYVVIAVLVIVAIRCWWRRR